MSFVWISMIFSLLTGCACGQSINTPPVDATEILGGVARFTCQVTFEHFHQTMTWKFKGKVVYQFFKDEGDYPLGTEKYKVTKNDNIFTLEVKDLKYNDGGNYFCFVTTVSARAVLIVLGKPLISPYHLSPVEGETITYKCEGYFGGPSKEEVSHNHYPRLSFISGSTALQGPVSIIEKENYNQMTKVHNITMSATMNHQKIMCEIGTSTPVKSETMVVTLNVFYSVRNARSSPQGEYFEVGTDLTCSADGNPQPTFEWENLDKQGHLVKSKWLNIAVDMVGKNHWRCIAKNSIRTVTHTKITTVRFEARESLSEEINHASQEDPVNTLSAPMQTTTLIFIILVLCTVIFIAIYLVRQKNRALHR